MKNLPGLLKKSTIFLAFALLAGAVMLLFGANASLAQDRPAPADPATEEADPITLPDLGLAAEALPASATGLYVIQLADRPLATYDGSLAGLAATSPAATGANRLDVNAPESIAYLNYLRTQHDNFISGAEIALGRSLDVRFQYLNVLNGLAIYADHAEALRLAELPGVKAVFADQERELTTDVGPLVIGAPAIWEGNHSLFTFHAELDGDQEVPPVPTSHTGEGTFTYDPSTMELTWEISHTIPLTDVTAAHIHVGAFGENGPPVITLDHTQNPMVGSETLAEAQVADLMNHLYYVNVHTSAYPAGEIRGQMWTDGHRGEGIIVGMLDTGVNPVHPSFAAVDGDGYEHENPYGSGNFVGVCDPGDPDHEDICNDKLIGAWNFHPSSPSATDWNNHGSHVGSTIGGNRHDAVFTVGSDVFTRTVSGVAPRANVISYLVCFPSCPQTSSVAATNQAIADGVHVLNYSISGADNPWNDIVDLAFLDATAAGMFVSASAGNDGPGPGSVAKTGPWNAAVAASTHNRVIANTVDATAPTPVPPELESMAAVPGTGPAIVADIEDDIIWAGDVDPANVRGCDPFPGGSFAGAIALIQRGDCTFATKVNNANAAGAIAVIVYNHVGGPPIVMGGLEPTTIPAVFIDNVNGDDLADFVSNSVDPTARINESTSVIVNDNWQDVVAGFSSRGPSQFDILKPDYIAPGVNILAAGFDGPDAYAFLQGTSMSSPHGAGAAALLIHRHPGWSVPEVKSALSLTGWQDMLREDGATPAHFFDMGSGRIDLTQAANIGLVMHETIANYENANPDIGGDPKTLNQPSMVDQNCLEECSWTRTVRSVADVPVTYNAVATGPAGMTISVDPASFTIDPGATQELEITVEVDLDVLPSGDWAFAQVDLEVDVSTLLGSHIVLEEDFEGAFPPTDWDVIDNGGDCIWLRNDEVPNGRPNYAGGDGFSAAADSDRCGFGTTMDTELHTPLLDLSDPGAASASLDFVASYRHLGSSSFQVHVSGDGGSDWDTLLHWTASVDPQGPGAPVSLDLTPYVGSSEVVVSFHYTAPSWDWWAQVDQIRVATFEAPSAADVHLPIAVVPVFATPIITVDPDEMSATQGPDEITTQILSIGNAGGVELNWTIEEAELPTGFNTAVVDCDSQPGIIIHDDGSIESGYSGNPDVVNEVIFVESFTPGYPTTLEAVCVAFVSLGPTTLDFDIVIFDDDGAGGAPGTELGSMSVDASGIPIFPAPVPVWHSFDISSLDITFESGTVYVGVRWAPSAPNVFIASDQSVTTPISGGYWWNDNANAWTPIPNSFPNYRALFVRTVIDLACNSPSDVSWLSVDPDSGTTGPDGSSDVTVTFDSTGLAPGEYQAFLCVNSDDPNTPLVEVPVMLEVLPGVEIEVSPESMESTQAQDTITSQTLTISNVGEGVLDWNIEQAEPLVAGPVPMAILNLPVGGDRANPTPDNGTAPASILPTASNQLLSDWSEGFDDITLLPGLGWALINNSEPLGPTGWFQGNPDVFPAHSGAPDSYIGANFNNTSGAGTISNWLLTPEITMNNGDEFTFWTRRTGSQWEDRLQVRLSTSGDSTDVGTGAFDVGDFTELLLDINPTYAPGGFPAVWTEYTITIGGLSGPTDGRLAFRYFVEDGGPLGTNSDYIGIDTVSYTSIVLEACADTADIPWLSVAPDSGSTPAGESDDVTVTFDSSGLDAGVYEALLCVFSNDPSNPVVEVPVTMTVEEFVAEYGVELAPATAAASGEPGDMVVYTLTITNTGNVADTFSLTADDNEWDVDLPDDVELGAGESTTFAVTVTIPANAEDGDMDTVTVTATSMGDPGESASSVLTTTADVEPEEFILYLPFIARN
jgi:subtilisin family serine protease